MAVIHEQLYQSEDLSEIDFADYLEKLIANLFLSYNSQQSGIKPITNLEHCRLHIETATPAGLLINELVTNAFKHAFPSGKGEIKINLKVDSNQQIHLSVTDNGRGLPPQLNWEESPSLGLRLVRLLSQQLDAEVQVKTNQKGTSFNIEFMPPKSTTKIS
jgi:two-component sensor histidine kinase